MAKFFIIFLIIFFTINLTFAEEIKLTTIMPGGDVVRGKQAAIGNTYKDTASASIPANGLIVEGNVGIGKTNPNANLEIFRTATGEALRLSSNSSNYPVYMTITDGTNIRYIGGAAAIISTQYIGAGLGIRADGGIQLVTSNTGNNGITITPAGNVGVGTITPQAKLDVAGGIRAILPKGSGTSVVVNSGALYQKTSSVIYKTNIRPFQDDFYKILKADPKAFVYKDTGTNDIGYIAEDFDASGLKDLVSYDKDGRPDSIAYDKMSLYAIEILKDHEKKIKELKAENEVLKSRLEALEAKIK